MTYKEKQNLIGVGIERLKGGLSWHDWNSELSNTDRLFGKEINIINRKIVGALVNEFGPIIEKDLLDKGNAKNTFNISEDVFEKVHQHTLQTTRNKLVNCLTQKILSDPDKVEEILSGNQNPILKDSDYQKIVTRAANRLEDQDEIAAQKSPVNLVFGVLLIVVGGAASLVFSTIGDGVTIFYGAIVVGIGLIAKYFIGLYHST